MPGTNDPVADDLESALANPEQETSAEPQADPILDALKPSGHVMGKETPAQPPQDWEKRYKSLRSEYDKRAQKANTLESILKNPQIAEIAKRDPATAQALAKAGLKLAQEEAEQAGDTASEDDAYWQSPEGRQELYEARMDLKFEIHYFGTETLGRRLTPQEETEVRKVINRAGSLTVGEAWKLTSAGQKAMLAAEQKRLAAAQAKAPGQRPRPTPPGLGGSDKLDMKKPVTEYNDQEKREFLRSLPQ